MLIHTLVAMLQLGASFPVKLEAPHVVDVRKQVWAGAIGRGADGATLQATYKQADTTAFQDSVGKSVVEVCRVVPDGVLMFLPSYSMLDRLVSRWKVGCPTWRPSACLKSSCCVELRAIDASSLLQRLVFSCPA